MFFKQPYMHEFDSQYLQSDLLKAKSEQEQTADFNRNKTFEKPKEQPLS